MNTQTRLSQRVLFISFCLCTVTAVVAQPQVKVNRDVLNYGADSHGIVTGKQTILIDNAGDGTLYWTVQSNQDWLMVSPSSGSGSGLVTVTVDPGTMPPNFHDASIDVLNTNNPGDKAHVSGILWVYGIGESEPPFGEFATPMDGSTVASSISITGWVLDDIGVESVAIFREDNLRSYYVGDAVFVEGALPDVEQSYPGNPQNYRAQWGYTVLTNSLPNGDGLYTFTAYARDKEGQRVSLGSKTITVDNANAVKPFGAIDTPAQGGVASGSKFINRGWVLTPQPNQIPKDGSTINVYVDGAKIGQPTYNIYRPDIAGLFPGYANSNGAVGYFEFDTTPYTNGVHQIRWIAEDGAGNSDGIGSRYFTIQNLDMPTPKSDKKRLNYGAGQSSAQTGTQSIHVDNIGQGTLNWDATPSAEWIKIEPSSGVNSDYMDVSVDPTGLDPGNYQGSVNILDPAAGQTSIDVSLSVDNGDKVFKPNGEINTPEDGSTVSGSVPVTGWALDATGVESVKIYAAQPGTDLQYIGDAVFVEGIRPDVAQAHTSTPMNYRAGWGYMMLTHFLPGGGNGTYIIDATATNYDGQETSLGSKTIIVDNANAVKPFGAIDDPKWGHAISGSNYKMKGWALAQQPNKIPVDGTTIDIYIDGVHAGHPTYNIQNTNISSNLTGYKNSDAAGWTYTLDTQAYEDGVHTISWSVSDESEGGSSKAMVSESADLYHVFVVQNDRPIVPPTKVTNFKELIPDQFTLKPVYPNPFNPSTMITYDLVKNSRVDLRVFDLQGRHVHTLLSNQMQHAGRHTLKWSGIDDADNRVASGVYLLVMKTERQKQTRKMILLK